MEPETQEAMDILIGLIDLENKVGHCMWCRQKFLLLWDTLVSSYMTMVLKGRSQ